MNFYQLSLWVTKEQELAIIELFRNRRWIYWKIGHEEQPAPARFQFLSDQVSQPQPPNQTFQTLIPEIQGKTFTEQLIGDRILDGKHVEHSNSAMPLNIDSYRNPVVNYSCRLEKSTASTVVNEFGQEATSKESENDKGKYGKQQNAVSEVDHIFQESGSKFESSYNRMGINRDMFPTFTKVKDNKSVQTANKQEKSKTKNIHGDEITNQNQTKKRSKKEKGLSTPMKKKQIRKKKGPKRDKTKSKVVNVYCQDCEHTFKYNISYQKHLIEDRCKHVCGVCGKVFLFSKTKDFEIHMKYHNKQKDFECSVCGKLFVERGSMLKHFNRHAEPKVKKVPAHACDQCGDSFSTEKALNIHKTNRHDESRGKNLRPACPRLAKSNTYVDLEYKTHDCPICAKLFTSYKLLKKHKATHKETNNFKCDQCDASFFNQWGLQVHKKMHKPEKAYEEVCVVCNKSFHDVAEFQAHKHDEIEQLDMTA